MIRNIKLAAVLAAFCAALCAQGAEDTYCSCPRDPRFLAYMRAVARIYAANHPASVWIDDDLRIDNHYPASRGSLDGCWCKTCIANLDGKDAIKKVGDYGGAFSALGRSSIEKAANNVMRTELLKALANAFNMQVETDSDGKARFNRAFLRNLERNPNLSARTACP